MAFLKSFEFLKLVDSATASAIVGGQGKDRTLDRTTQ